MSIEQGYGLVALIVGLLSALVGWKLARRGDDDEPGPHKLIEGMVSALPPVGAPFQGDAKERWVECVAYILDVVWPPEDDLDPDPGEIEESEGSLPLTSANVEKIISDVKPKPPARGSG